MGKILETRDFFNSFAEPEIGSRIFAAVVTTHKTAQFHSSSSFQMGSDNSSNLIFGTFLMRRQLSLLFLALLILIPQAAHAQAWSGILNPTRAINWQRSTVGVPGGIPANWTQCGATIAAYTGTADTINKAISTCSGQSKYVLLGPGTFNLTTRIAMAGGVNHVSLRGSGANSTFLVFTTAISENCAPGPSAICMSGAALVAGSSNTMPPCGGANALNCAYWTGGFAKNATSIIVTNVGAAGILNNDQIVLDQANEVADNGGFLICNSGTSGNVSPQPGCFQESGYTSSTIGRFYNGVDHSQQQYVTVVSGCSPKCVGGGPFTLTITPGLYANNWNQGAGAGTTGVYFTKPATYIGLENLTVDNLSGAAGRGPIAMVNCDFCWVKGVKSVGGVRQHIWLYQDYRAEIRDSYFFGTAHGGNQSYGIEVGEPGGGDSLIENNIFQQIAGPIVAGGASGVVVGYNFTINNLYSQSANFMQGSSPNHDAGNYYWLWEGNQINGLFADITHGSSGLFTYFRNRVYGRDYNGAILASIQTYPIDADALIRGVNVIGNVLGVSGYHTSYEAYPPSSTAQCNTVIYYLGWSGLGCTANNIPADALVRSTMMRWGNYDVATGTVRWDATESSPGAVTYIAAQSTPATQTLPASFYLSSRPSWFGGTPFPVNGPDVTGGIIGTPVLNSNLGGHANNNPAANCYYAVMGGPQDGTGSVLSFDANRCYYGSTSEVVDPPTGLTAAVN